MFSSSRKLKTKTSGMNSNFCLSASAAIAKGSGSACVFHRHVDAKEDADGAVGPRRMRNETRSSGNDGDSKGPALPPGYCARPSCMPALPPYKACWAAAPKVVSRRNIRFTTLLARPKLSTSFPKLELEVIQTMGILLSILYGGRRWRRRTDVVVVNTGPPGGFGYGYGYGGGPGYNAGVSAGHPPPHVHVQGGQSNPGLGGSGGGGYGPPRREQGGW